MSGKEESKKSSLSQTQVDKWINGLRSREVKEGSSKSQGGVKTQESYNISFRDVKEQPVKVYDSQGENKFALEGTNWQYTYQNDPSLQSKNQAQNFNNQFSSGTYGFEDQSGKQSGSFKGLQGQFGVSNQNKI